MEGETGQGALDRLPVSLNVGFRKRSEGLNALLLLDEQYGREDSRYRNAFLKQWAFIEEFQTDSRHAGWHSEVSAEGTPPPGLSKSDAWKDPYHQGRALMRCIEVLRN